jgi:hypothetical protein
LIATDPISPEPVAAEVVATAGVEEPVEPPASPVIESVRVESTIGEDVPVPESSDVPGVENAGVGESLAQAVSVGGRVEPDAATTDEVAIARTEPGSDPEQVVEVALVDEPEPVASAVPVEEATPESTQTDGAAAGATTDGEAGVTEGVAAVALVSEPADAD